MLEKLGRETEGKIPEGLWKKKVTNRKSRNSKQKIQSKSPDPKICCKKQKKRMIRVTEGLPKISKPKSKIKNIF